MVPRSRPFFLILLASVLLASQARAQAGTVVALRGPTGWLSASDNGTVSISTNANAAGWEQWMGVQLRNGMLALQSFHGTLLESHVGQTPNAANAVPWTYTMWADHSHADVDPLGAPAIVMDAGGMRAYTSMPIVGGRIVIGDGLGRLLINTTATWDSDDTRLCIRSDLTSCLQTYGWNVVAVPNPQSGRVPLRYAVSRSGLQYGLKAALGGYVQDGGSGTQAKKGPTEAGFVVYNLSSTTTPSARIGDNIRISQNYVLQRSTIYTVGTQLGVQWDYDNPSRQWKILDPTGIHPVGSRIGADQPICLQAEDGQLLSAEPSSPALRMSPNGTRGCNMSGTWEIWSFTPRFP